MAAKKRTTKAAGQTGKVYGYARISTDKQDLDRQQKDIFTYAAKHGLTAPQITTETISSRNGDRQIFPLIDSLEKGDILVVTELSRLARSMIELNGMIADVLKKGASIHVTTGKPVDASIESQCLVFALGLVAQIERNMISERTKSALKARKAEGVKLGRPEGKGRKVDETLKERGWTPDHITDMAQAGLSTAKIARLIGLDQRTVGAWLKAQETPEEQERQPELKTIVNPGPINGQSPVIRSYFESWKVAERFNKTHRGLKAHIFELAYAYDCNVVIVYDSLGHIKGPIEYL